MTISAPMQRRLDNLDKHLKRNSLHVAKKWGCPVLRSNECNRNRSLTYFGPTGTGFSWIAFLFPFAVYTQIRELSFFAYQASIFIITAWIYVFAGTDLSISVGIGIGVIYGFWFPYFRHLALKNHRPEYTRLQSIIIGLFLSFASIFPSLVIETLFVSS